jgi:hypothetical protein
MREASGEVEDAGAYTPPASGHLTAEQVTRLLAVHGRVREAMGPRWTDIRARVSAIESRGRGDGAAFTLADLREIFSELGTLPVEARRAHVAALNAERFSQSEYRWVQVRAYEAAGIELAAAVDWRALETALAQGAERVGVRVPVVPMPDIPEENRALVKPHLAALRDWLPLTVLGM